MINSLNFPYEEQKNKKITCPSPAKKHGKDNTWSFSNFGSKRKGSVPVQDISPSLSYF